MNKLWDWIRRTVWSEDESPRIKEIKMLSEQFYVTLRAAISRVEARFGEPPPALLRIREILGRNRTEWTWNCAYEVEQQLVQLYDAESLRTELGRRIVEASAALRPELGEWYREEFGRVQSEDDQRALLLRLLNDLQWRYSVNEVRRAYSRQLAQRIGLIFIVVVGLFCLLLVHVYRADATSTDMLMLAGVSGLWGAAFSMLITVRRRVEKSSFNQLSVSRYWSLLLARLLVGLGAALVLFFFLESNLLKGDLFPAMPSAEPKELAQLIVWCFLAGFSETLVLGLLAKAEKQVGEAPLPPPQALPAMVKAKAKAPRPEGGGGE